MTPTEQRSTEKERIAYELGYRQCCRDHGTPYIETRKPFADKDIMIFHVEISYNGATHTFPDHADELAKYITKKLEEGYEKFKRGEPLD